MKYSSINNNLDIQSQKIDKKQLVIHTSSNFVFILLIVRDVFGDLVF